LTKAGFLPFFGLGACTDTVATHSPDLMPITLPREILQNFFEDFEVETLVTDFFTAAMPRPLTRAEAAIVFPMETVGEYTVTAGVLMTTSGVLMITVVLVRGVGDVGGDVNEIGLLVELQVLSPLAFTTLIRNL
jgi:hypothetical protein